MTSYSAPTKSTITEPEVAQEVNYRLIIPARMQPENIVLGVDILIIWYFLCMIEFINNNSTIEECKVHAILMLSGLRYLVPKDKHHGARRPTLKTCLVSVTSLPINYVLNSPEFVWDIRSSVVASWAAG